MLTDPEQDYAEGSLPFLGATICLDSRPLIPRSETEFWVEKAIQKITLYGTEVHSKGIEESITVLDLFAGSGAVGVSVLMHVPHTHVTFGELVPAHLETIKKTLAVNGIDPARAAFTSTDVWSGIEGKFDFVLANPPYVSRERMTAERSVLEHEPHEALFAENDGFALVQKTVEGLPAHLTRGGELWIEHEPFQTERLSELAREQNLRVETHLDQYGTQRFSVLSATTPSTVL